MAMYELRGSRRYDLDPRIVWAAIADPVAYFSWSPAAKLVAPPEALQPVMRLEIVSPVLGRTHYEHRIDAEALQVTHVLVLRTGGLNLGEETHTWKIQPENAGACVVSQTMRVEQRTLASRLAEGYLKAELGKALEGNFDLVGAWLRDNPNLSTARVDALGG